MYSVDKICLTLMACAEKVGLRMKDDTRQLWEKTWRKSAAQSFRVQVGFTAAYLVEV